MKRASPTERHVFLLVDGNNILHAWEDLARLDRIDRGAAQRELIRRLATYRDRSDVRVVLVFDGRGVRTEEERPEPGFQVIYSSRGKTADDIIERLAVSYAGFHDLTVATNDRAEQDMVVGAGGFAISAEELRERVERAEQQLSEWLARRRRR